LFFIFSVLQVTVLVVFHIVTDLNSNHVYSFIA